MMKKRKTLLALSIVIGLMGICTACGEKETVEEESSATVIAVEECSSGDGAKITTDFTQAQLYYKCLNTLEALRQLSGSVRIRNGVNSNTITQGTFAFDFTADQYQAGVNYLDAAEETICLQTNTYYNTGGTVTSLYDYYGAKENTYTVDENGATMDGVTFANAVVAADASVQSIGESNLYATLGQDPTNAHELAGCFVPQEMTLGYLENFENWEITGTTEVQGRTCAVVTGTAEPDYGSRFGVTTFEILVDQETGIWMQYEGYDEAGEVVDYIYTQDIQFGEEATAVEAISDAVTQGYAFEENTVSIVAE